MGNDKNGTLFASGIVDDKSYNMSLHGEIKAGGGFVGNDE